MPHSIATVAEYFRLAIESGALSSDLAKTWADGIVENFTVPPGDVVEVAWSKSEPQLVAALGEVSGERDRQVAARWGFHVLHERLEFQDDPDLLIQAAKHVVVSAGLEADLHDTLTSIEAILGVAKLGYHGTVEDALCRFAQFLAREAIKPPSVFQVSNGS